MEIDERKCPHCGHGVLDWYTRCPGCNQIPWETAEGQKVRARRRLRRTLVDSLPFFGAVGLIAWLAASWFLPARNADKDLLKRLKGAPEPVLALIKSQTGDSEDFKAIEKARAEAKALGGAAAPWLNKILIEDYSGHVQARTAAAELLGELGRWEELFTALDSSRFDASSAARDAFDSRVLVGKPEEVSKRLRRVEAIARGSAHPLARAEAMGILAGTQDAGYSKVCLEGLVYDRSSLAGAESGLSELQRGGRLGEALRAFKLMCALEDDASEVREPALGCLEKLKDPRALPTLIELAAYNDLGFLRHETYQVLSSIAKKDFGGLESATDADAPIESARRNSCQRHRDEAVRIVKDAKSENIDAAEAARRIDAVNVAVRKEAAAQAGSDPDARIVAAWQRWGRALPKTTASAEIPDRKVAEESSKAMGTTIELYASGKVVVARQKPGSKGQGKRTFNNIGQWAKHIEWIQKSSGAPHSADEKKLAAWVEKDALPRLEARRLEKQPHAAETNR